MRLVANYELLHALAGCGRRCAILFAQGREAFPLDTGMVLPDTVLGVRIYMEIVHSLSGFSRPPSAHSRSEYRTESTMKLGSPSFTGVLVVALRTRVCGMETDSVWISSSPHCCVKSVIACREEFLGLLGRSRFEQTVCGITHTVEMQRPVQRATGRAIEQHCCAKVVTARRVEFGPAGAHSHSHSRFQSNSVG